MNKEEIEKLKKDPSFRRELKNEKERKEAEMFDIFLVIVWFAILLSVFFTN